MSDLKDKLVNLFVAKVDAKVVKTDGAEVIIVGGSLSIFSKENITGRDKNGGDVSIAVAEIQDVVAA